MRISNWSSDVCSSDLAGERLRPRRQISYPRQYPLFALFPRAHPAVPILSGGVQAGGVEGAAPPLFLLWQQGGRREAERDARNGRVEALARRASGVHRHPRNVGQRSEEHTSELQSLMRISYAV